MILSKPLKKQQSSTDNQQDGSLDFSQNKEQISDPISG